MGSRRYDIGVLRIASNWLPVQITTSCLYHCGILIYLTIIIYIHSLLAAYIDILYIA